MEKPSPKPPEVTIAENQPLNAEQKFNIAIAEQRGAPILSQESAEAFIREISTPSAEWLLTVLD